MQDLVIVVAARDWTAVPAIRIVGAVLGTLLLVAALRAILGKRGGK